MAMKVDNSAGRDPGRVIIDGFLRILKFVTLNH